MRIHKDLKVKVLTAKSGSGLMSYTYKIVQIGGFKGQSNDNIIAEDDVEFLADVSELVESQKGVTFLDCRKGKCVKIKYDDFSKIVTDFNSLKNPKRNEWKMLSKMITIVSEEFNGRLDKGGRPYILHCIRVMDGVDQNDPELMQIAIGHDLIEDSDGRWTAERLREEGFSERVISGIVAMTHDPEVPYMEYIKTQIVANEDATKCKKSDLRDNTKVTRLKSLRDKDFDNLKKYHKAYSYLMSDQEDPKQ